MVGVEDSNSKGFNTPPYYYLLGFTKIHQTNARLTTAKQVNAARTLLHMDAKHADTTEQDATY
jgi:hypothetical protein